MSNLSKKTPPDNAFNFSIAVNLTPSSGEGSSRCVWSSEVKYATYDEVLAKLSSTEATDILRLASECKQKVSFTILWDTPPDPIPPAVKGPKIAYD